MIKKSKFIPLIIISLLSTLLIGCSNSKVSENKPNNKITVAVSIVPEATFVNAVAGDLVNIVTLIPPGKSPENSEPTPKTLEDLSNSNLYFTIGVPTEDATILPKISSINKDIKIVSLSKEVSKIYKQRFFGPNSPDPHIWLSPKRVKIMISTIKDQLCSIDPKNSKTYTKNAQNYTKKLDIADKNIISTLKGSKNKIFIISHPAFGYFAEDYNLNMLTLEKEGKEAKPQDMEKLIDIAKEQNLKTIFYEEEIDSKQSKSFAESINGTTQKISPLSPNYIENLESIARALSNSMK